MGLDTIRYDMIWCDMISNQARQQNLNCNLDVDNRSGVGSVECEVRRNPLEYTRVHSFSQSVSWFQLQAHGYHMAPFKRFPVGRATLGKKRKKKLWKQIQLKKKKEKNKVSRPYRQGYTGTHCLLWVFDYNDEMMMMQPAHAPPTFSTAT